MEPAPEIAAAEAAEEIAGGALVVDVREQVEWDAGHISGAVWIPLGELGRRVEELPRDRRMVIVCRTGSRSGYAADALHGAGYDVANLRAELFDTVEENSSYYAIPTAEAAAAWARRTPDGFVFHVKAFGMMTRHPVKADQLPPDLRGEVEVDHRGRVDHPSRELRAEVFDRFRAALEPLREAGKLGGILMQFPPYVV